MQEGIIGKERKGKQHGRTRRTYLYVVVKVDISFVGMLVLDSLGLVPMHCAGLRPNSWVLGVRTRTP